MEGQPGDLDLTMGFLLLVERFVVRRITERGLDELEAARDEESPTAPECREAALVLHPVIW